MQTLREVQEQFARGLVCGDLGQLAGWIDDGPIAAKDRFDVYCDNRDGALVNALKLAYPAVHALVGDAFFAEAARAFARSAPPRSAFLTLYGDGFGDFLAAHPQTISLPYLAEVARLEWAVARAASLPRGPSRRRVVLGEVAIVPALSLTLLRVRHSAAAIWRAAVAADEGELARIVPDPTPVAVAIWRAGAGADAVALSPPAAAFVAALLDRATIQVALTQAAALTTEPIAVIADEVLRADFVQLEPLASTPAQAPAKWPPGSP
jgi:hypothetical protein